MRPATRSIATFLALAAVLSVPFYVPILRAGSMTAGNQLWLLGLTAAPAVAALLTRLLLQRNVRGIGWRAGAPRFWALAYLLPLCAIIPVYSALWLSGLGALDRDAFLEGQAQQYGLTGVSLPLAILYSAVVVVVMTMPFALGEEIGWRGLLVPELAKIGGFGRACAISAPIWIVYHVPAMLFTDYRSAAPLAYVVLCFGVMICAMTVVVNWLRLASGSVWPAAIFHAAHNTFVFGIFDRLTADTGPTVYFEGEFGAGLALGYALVALWCWRRRDAIPASG